MSHFPSSDKDNIVFKRTTEKKSLLLGARQQVRRPDITSAISL